MILLIKYIKNVMKNVIIVTEREQKQIIIVKNVYLVIDY